jgi:hypothetical protein
MLYTLIIQDFLVIFNQEGEYLIMDVKREKLEVNVKLWKKVNDLLEKQKEKTGEATGQIASRIIWNYYEHINNKKIENEEIKEHPIEMLPSKEDLMINLLTELNKNIKKINDDLYPPLQNSTIAENNSYIEKWIKNENEKLPNSMKTITLPDGRSNPPDIIVLPDGRSSPNYNKLIEIPCMQRLATDLEKTIERINKMK